MSVTILTVLHNIFLTWEQRYALQIPESEIEIVGICSPVWIHKGEHITKIAEEVFAKYKFRHCPEPEKQTVTLDSEGFTIRLSPEMPIFLMDVQDGGQEYLAFNHKNTVEAYGSMASIIHFVNIEDMQVLEKTLC